MDKKALLLALAVITLAACNGEPDSGGKGAEQPARGWLKQPDKPLVADMVTITGRKIGVATVTAKPDGVEFDLKLTVENLLPVGEPGYHIVQSSGCEKKNFQSPQPHWNPTNAKHGRKNPQGYHLGDLANLGITAGNGGKIHDVQLIRGITIDKGPSGGHVLRDKDGFALEITAADDQRTDPYGAGDMKIACASFPSI